MSNNEVAKLPTLADLNQDIEQAFKNDAFNLLLNKKPPESWLKKHPYINGGNHVYLPIERIELMLTQIFQQWTVQVNSFSQLFNAVAVHVTLKVRNPLTGDWIEQDGLGAAPIQTNAGASASDMGAIKNDAVMKALPTAESYAIKDAAEKLGKLFGKDLNRKDELVFEAKYATQTQWTKPEANGTE